MVVSKELVEAIVGALLAVLAAIEKLLSLVHTLA